MNQAIKAALFSALLFPGWGQFYLKQHKRGLAFLLPVLIGLLVLAWSIIEVSVAIIRAARLEKGPVQLGNVIRITHEAMSTLNSSYFLFMMLLMVALWILSIVDAYQLGKKAMMHPTIAGHQESASGHA